MNEAHVAKLYHDFLRLYAELDGFACHDRWYDVIYQLSEDLCRLANKAYEPAVLSFEGSNGYYPAVLEVKEKFGRLRVSVAAVSEEMQALVYQVEAIDMD
ncbi:MAG: hypothetical protein Q9M28_08810 [Mariprofundaceae bacterium]|nr:hypothetical protein [Mariprofundaceae bacterium]